MVQGLTSTPAEKCATEKKQSVLPTCRIKIPGRADLFNIKLTFLLLNHANLLLLMGVGLSLSLLAS